MTPLKNPEMQKLNGYLEAMSDLIVDGQYKWYFDAHAFQLKDIPFDPRSIFKAAYPQSVIEKADIAECTVDEMINRIDSLLPRHALPNEYDAMRTIPLLSYDAGLWRNIQGCVNLEASQILEYLPSEEERKQWISSITREFRFIIYDRKQQRCLVLMGGDKD